MLTATTHPAFQTPINNEIDGITVNHKDLLRDLLQSSNSLLEIAADHKLNLQQLIVWMNQPAIRNLLDAADELAQRIAAHKAAQARPAAVQLLNEHILSLCETVRDRDQAGRAARALLRLPIGGLPSEPGPTPQLSQRIGELRAELCLPKPSRLHSTPKKHPANPRRAKLPVPTNPDPPEILRIPIYRFRPEPISPMSPMGPIGPIPLVPHEVIDPQTTPQTSAHHSNGHIHENGHAPPN